MNQTAMQQGRDRQLRAARRESVRRVKAYRDWLKRDVQYTMNLRAHEAGIGRHPGSRPRMPELPSKHDYEVADAA